MSALFIDASIEGEVVTMPRAEFERLIEIVEDAQDLLSAVTVQRKLASGEEETVPSAFVDRMLAGETLARLWREHRGISEQALATKTGLSLAEISQIEQGHREASLHELKALAKGLRVTLDDLVR